MKKLSLCVFLVLMFCNVGNSKEMISIEEYYKQHKATEPATLVYLGSRCLALFMLSSDLLKETDKEISDIYMRDSSDLAFFAGEVLKKEFGHTEEEAIESLFEAIHQITDLYKKDAKDNNARTGQYILGSSLEKDAIHCSKFHEFAIDWIKNN